MTTPDLDNTAEEPVDETADARRLHHAGLIEYQLLTDTDRHALRMERAHGLESDLYRIELQLEEATDAAQRENLAVRADLLLRRLRVHLTALAGVLADPGERRPLCSRGPS